MLELYYYLYYNALRHVFGFVLGLCSMDWAARKSHRYLAVRGCYSRNFYVQGFCSCVGCLGVIPLGTLAESIYRIENIRYFCQSSPRQVLRELSILWMLSSRTLETLGALGVSIVISRYYQRSREDLRESISSIDILIARCHRYFPTSLREHQESLEI